MMSARGGVPDAWDDDWISKADKPPIASSESSQTSLKTSQKERRARQAELNRKLWEEAEAPSSPYFVDSRNEVPLKSEFKPTMKVLSRKPAPKLVARKDPSSGIDQLTLEDEEDDDEESRPPTLTMEERQQRAQREREEKQKKYEEVRERLFGALDGTVGASSSSGNTSPPTNRDVKSRGRSKGAKESRSSSSAGIKSRQLYDPNDPVKQDSLTVQKKDQQTPVSGHSTPSEDQLLRQPKGPDGSGRGGFGFEGRGGTTT